MSKSNDELSLFWQWITQKESLESDQPAINDLFLPHAHLSQTEALSIYNNAYHSRLVEVSKQLYPITYRSLGDEVYRSLWVDYLSEYPPKSGSINQIGEKLPIFLFNHDAFKKLPALVDIVKLEWLFIDLFGKVDESSFPLDALQLLPAEQWPTTVWQAKQDWRLTSSAYDLKQYWQQIHEYYRGDVEAGSGDVAVQPLKHIQRYLVRRDQYNVQFERIGEHLWFFLGKIREEKTFSEICDSLVKRFPEEDVAKLSLDLLLKSIGLNLLLQSEMTPA